MVEAEDFVAVRGGGEVEGTAGETAVRRMIVRGIVGGYIPKEVHAL